MDNSTLRNSRFNATATGISICLLLSACGSFPPKNQLNQAQQNIAWLEHQANLEKAQHWQFDGRFSAQNDTESWHGSIRWSQKNNHFEVYISGPLNSGSLSLTGDDTLSTLNLGKDKNFTAKDPELLLETYTGLRLPIKNLRYWLTGIPSPKSERDIVLNNEGVLGHLSQKGWDVSFKNYHKINNTLLPKKIFLESQTYDVRLLIKNWQLPLPESETSTTENHEP